MFLAGLLNAKGIVMKLIRLLTSAALLGLAACMVPSCASDPKQRQALTAEGVNAEGGLPNVAEVTPDKAQTGTNYPNSAVSSTEERFSAVGPGSQTTLFNRSFGTVMAAGVLKAQKVRAITQENDEITVEGLEIDNSANAAPAWAKAVEPSLIAQITAQKEAFIAQVKALEETGKAVAPLVLELAKAVASGL